MDEHEMTEPMICFSFPYSWLNWSDWKDTSDYGENAVIASNKHLWDDSSKNSSRIEIITPLIEMLTLIAGFLSAMDFVV